MTVRTCWICGCTDARACEGGCAWAEGWEDLCTSCVEVLDEVLELVSVEDVDTRGLT